MLGGSEISEPHHIATSGPRALTVHFILRSDISVLRGGLTHCRLGRLRARSLVFSTRKLIGHRRLPLGTITMTCYFVKFRCISTSSPLSRHIGLRVVPLSEKWNVSLNGTGSEGNMRFVTYYIGDVALLPRTLCLDPHRSTPIYPILHHRPINRTAITRPSLQ